MRIISPIRDYYDSAQGFGADQSRIFLRRPEVLAEEKGGTPKELSLIAEQAASWSGLGWAATLIPIVFCGKLYYGLRLAATGGAYRFPDATSVHYSIDAAVAWASTVAHEEEGARIREVIERKAKAQLRTLAAQGQDLPPSVQTWLANNQAAILAVDAGMYKAWLTKNTSLGALQFYKLFSPTQAYQQIDMYLSGILAAENRPMVEISDKVRAQQHGFDCNSFRKSPTKRKPKSCVPMKP